MVLNTTLFTNVDEMYIDGLLQSPTYQNPLLLSYENNRITTIGQRFFMVATSIQTISLPNCSRIPDYCFDRCSSLTSITLDWSQISTVGAYAFRSCYSLPSMPEMSACLSIGSYAFQCCSALETIIFPNCTTVYTYAFQSCTKLYHVSLPSVTTLQANAFRNGALRDIYIPQVGAIQQSAFQYNWYLSSPLYLNRCNDIQSVAFHSCPNLPAVYMNWSQSTANIRTSAFFWCTHLLSFYLLGSVIPTLQNVNVFNSTPISTYTTSTGGERGKIYVPESLYASYIASTNWVNYSSVIYSLTSQQQADIIEMMQEVTLT